MKAASLPPARAVMRSAPFAAMSFFASRLNALAATRSARFLVSVSARATSRAAIRARRPICST